MTNWSRRGLAALLGAFAAAALPPVHAVPLLIPAFTGLVWIMASAPGWRAAFARGWWFGLGFYGAGLYWVPLSFLVDPARFGWMMPFAIIGLAGGMALFPALAVLIAWRFGFTGVRRALILAAAWTLLEWVTGWAFTGFPLLLIGSAWDISLGMLQFASLAGVWGLSLLTVFVAALPSVRRWREAFLGALLLAGVWSWGTLRLDHPSAMTGITLRLIQPAIAQTAKWQPDQLAGNFRRLLAFTERPGEDKVAAVIWPETAVPYFAANEPVLLSVIGQAAPPSGLIITGALRTTPQPREPFVLWNSLHAIDGAGRVVGTYDKFHLVPFGEYMPFRRFIPIPKLTAGSTDFSTGPGLQTLRLPGLPPVSPLICYESIFPGQAVKRTDRPAWILNISNDAWFGRSSGPYQLFASARLRAIEEGLPLVRAANTGISGIVDPYGRVLARLDLGREGNLDGPLPAAAGETPYARYGDGVVLLTIAIIACLTCIRRKRW